MDWQEVQLCTKIALETVTRFIGGHFVNEKCEQFQIVIETENLSFQIASTCQKVYIHFYIVTDHPTEWQ